MKPTIYLTFKGNCLEAMTFYSETLGGKTRGKCLFSFSHYLKSMTYDYAFLLGLPLILFSKIIFLWRQ